jgi:hypothetical protein
VSLADPIICAGAQDLPDMVDGPDMRETLTGMSRPIVLGVITLTPDEGGDAKESSRSVRTSGFLIPAEPRTLDIKDDGDGTRKWKYWALYVLNDPVVSAGDRITLKGVPYKVMKTWDWGQFGFHKFGIREDFRR